MKSLPQAHGARHTKSASQNSNELGGLVSCMDNSDPIANAHRQNQLWPSIHSAVEVLHRCTVAKAGAYELIWRLIHIWEATVITLASAGATRLKSEDVDSDAFRGARERLFGMALDDAGQVVKTGPGALDGSIDQWIEILNQIAKLPLRSEDQFLGRLQRFLTTTGAEQSQKASVNLDPLVRSWGAACDVTGIRSEPVPALEAMKAINTFRNRFAHVPFPYDQVDNLHIALESATSELFAISTGGAGPDSPLNGTFVASGAGSKGGAFGTIVDQDSGREPRFAVGGKKWLPSEIWGASPFLESDEMMRWYLLTRLKNSEGVWEYTRYLAESNAVIERNDPDLLDVLRRPTNDEYPDLDSEADGLSDVPDSPPTERQASMATALTALRDRKFSQAIPLLREYLEHRPDYHIGWSRLGYCLREQAVEEASAGNVDKSLKMLAKAEFAFTTAHDHRDLYYQADALYQRSKTHWRTWMVARGDERGSGELEKAMSDARAATDAWDDSKFASWLEFLEGFKSSMAKPTVDA